MEQLLGRRVKNDI